MVVKEGGRELVVLAKNAEELKAKHPAAFDIFRNYADNSANRNLPRNGIFGGNGLKGLQFEGADGFNLKGLEGFRNFEPGQLGNQTQEMMRQQLKQLRDSNDVRGTPLEDLIDQLEKQVDGVDPN
jgi:hypothetical protein